MPQNVKLLHYVDMQDNRFKEVPTEEYLKLGFQHGFEAVVEH